MTTLYITHPACRLHDMGESHPESPARLEAINDQLQMSGLSDIVLHAQAPDASDADILRVHTAEHLQYVQENSPTTDYISIGSDAVMNPHTLTAARVAAGAGIRAVDSVMSGEHQNVFCAVRPPGHHATPTQAMGFCFFNNIAIAAAYALDVHKLDRVAIIDFDVHHGNGTEDAFAGDSRVMMCGFFQHPFYPGGSHTPPAANMINVPVSAGTSGAQLRQIVTTTWMPALKKFQPQLIFISAGFDAHRDDDLGQLAMTEDDYAWITTQLVKQAGLSANGRIVSMLEGGYNLSALGRSVVAHIQALSDIVE